MIDNQSSGSVCARTNHGSVCFFAGESGSPLMVKYVFNTNITTLGTSLLYCQCSRQDGNPDKLYIEGIASYMEGENITTCNMWY